MYYTIDNRTIKAGELDFWAILWDSFIRKIKYFGIFFEPVTTGYSDKAAIEIDVSLAAFFFIWSFPMYSYGTRSTSVFETLHPELQILFGEIIKVKNVSLLEGYRSNERQQELFDAGKSKVKPGGSKHNRWPSEAVDQIPYPFHKGDWEDRDKFHLHAGFVLGVAARLKAEGMMTRDVRWGGDWDKDWEASDNAFDDFPHIELI